MGLAQFERRPTITAQVKLMVGRRGEAQLVPPDMFRKFKLDGAVPNPLPSRRSRALRLGSVVVFGLLVACLVWGRWPGSESPAERRLRQARRTAWEGRHEAALKQTEQALLASPSFAAAHLFAAETAIRLRQPLVALEHCQRVQGDRRRRALARARAGRSRACATRRVGPDGQSRTDLVVEITQTFRPSGRPGVSYRGGCTLIVDLEVGAIRYIVRKRITSPGRVGDQARFQSAAEPSHRGTYFGGDGLGAEPFAV